MKTAAHSPLAAAQLDQMRYAQRRIHQPELFGNAADGSMDGTPESGPYFVFACYKDTAGKLQIMPLWSVHKHDWPLQFVYLIGDPVESRGERTPPELMIDIRDLGDAIGKNRITNANWGSRSHLEVLTRALGTGLLDTQIEAIRLRYATQQGGAA